MTDPKRDNRGMLWRNKYKERDDDDKPDWTGPVTVGSVEWRLALWWEEKDGVERMSARFTVPKEKSSGGTTRGGAGAGHRTSDVEPEPEPEPDRAVVGASDNGDDLPF